MTPNASLEVGGYHTESPEVLYTRTTLTKASCLDIDQLKRLSLLNPRKRIRLCTHSSPSDSLHEMLIVHEQNTYVRPHKHPRQSESVHIIEGIVDVVAFDDEGGIKEVIRMGDYASGFKFYYRMVEPLFHTLIIRSPFLVFHETTNGPFDRNNVQFAPWSPLDTEEGGVKAFMGSLNDRVKLV